MFRAAMLMVCGMLGACVAPVQGVPKAPPEEAMSFKFPPVFPEKDHVRIEGNTAAAIQLAVDDFLPREVRPAPAPDLRAPCLSRREAYEVTAAPAPESVVLVRFVVDPKVCQTDDSIEDVTTYAVDIRTQRILSVEAYTRPRKQ